METPKVIEEHEMFEPAEVTVSIRPVLTVALVNTYDQDSDGNVTVTEKERASLIFHIKAGKDAKYLWDAGDDFDGPREGPLWEAVIEHWRKQFDYLSRYLGEALLKSARQLCYENDILMYSENGVVGFTDDNQPINPPLDALLSTSKDLNKFDEIKAANPIPAPVDKTVGHELQALRSTALRMPMFQNLVGWYAYGARARMRNEALLQVGSNRLLRFSDEMVDKYIALNEELAEVWQIVKPIVKRNRVHWQEQVKKIRDGLPNDLIEAARGDYRPSQIARVHAARLAGFTTYENPYEIPSAELTMSQEQTIKNEVAEYIKRKR